MEASGWPPPSRRRISRSSGRPDIWPRRLLIDSRPRDRSSLLQSPTRGLCFSHISSTGCASLFTPSSVDYFFYYGIDVHDLAPNFILNITTFIVVCEAFLHIPPHFGLWLKTFNVKPKVASGQQAECRGAMVGMMPNVTWPKGSFAETVKGWQSGWFYITKPCDAN